MEFLCTVVILLLLSIAVEKHSIATIIELRNAISVTDIQLYIYTYIYTYCPCGVWCRGLTNYLLYAGPLVESRKTTSMEDVSASVLEKIKKNI